jgi:hypothetical protein
MLVRPQEQSTRPLPTPGEVPFPSGVVRRQGGQPLLLARLRALWSGLLDPALAPVRRGPAFDDQAAERALRPFFALR